mgnify:CR=1 FL=1
MKIRTIRYIVKDGIANISKNKLMSLAAISIVVASLTIFGIFYILILNFEYNVMNLREQPEIQVFCDVNLDEVGVKLVENALTRNSKIKQITVVTKEQAFEKVKEMLGDDASVLEGIENDFLPVSFIVKLYDPEDSEQVMQEVEQITGVASVKYPQRTVEFISKFSNWVQFVSSILIFVLLVVSVFIISNTIRLTVFARRREISIMKYIGATDWFIRLPFIVEGVVLGIIGAIIAFLISGYGYSAIEGKLTNDLAKIGVNIISLIKIHEIGTKIIAFYVILGCIVGAVGSALSIRKYLKV